MIREPARPYLPAERGDRSVPLVAFAASVIRSGCVPDRRSVAPGAHYASVYGGPPQLLTVRRAALPGAWRAYLGAKPAPDAQEFRPVVRAAEREYRIRWDAGPLFDGRERVYYDADPRPGSAEFRVAVEEGLITW